MAVPSFSNRFLQALLLVAAGLIAALKLGHLLFAKSSPATVGATRLGSRMLQKSVVESTVESVVKSAPFLDPASLPFQVPKGYSILNEDLDISRVQRVYSSPDLAPSPAFVAAWKRYADMHNRFTKAVRQQKMAEITASGMRGAIQVRPAGQLANRIMASASSFLLGLLTDRAVYVSFRGDYYASFEDMFEDPGIDIEPPGELSFLSSSGGANTHVGLAEPFNPGEEVMNDLTCNDMTKGFGGGTPEKPSLLNIASNQYFLPLIAHNPVYASRLRELFPDGDIFGAIVRTLFRPSKAVVAMKDEWKQQMGWNDHYVVGLQVRTGGDFTDAPFAQQDWDLLLGCGELMMSLQNGLAFNPSASHAEAEARKKKTAFFVATDIEWSRDAALKQLGRTGVPVWEFGEFMRSNTPIGCQQAFVDILLLSESNDVLTTPWSTFGYFAAGLTRKRPTMLTKISPAWNGSLPTAHEELTLKGEMTYNGVPMHIDHRDGCARLPTAEPCFHFLPKYHAEKTSCYKQSTNPWLEAEMRGGRFC